MDSIKENEKQKDVCINPRHNYSKQLKDNTDNWSHIVAS